MALLTDYAWKIRYDPDDGPLISQFYDQALACAQRYDRTTGYFTAPALTLAARGVEGLVLNAGRMRMVVGCTLDAPEADAIERGESLRGTVQASLARMPLVAASATEREALELLAWMVAKGHLEVKVAIPCDAQRRVIPGTAIFHEKAGVIEDKAGDRLAFAGSVNETAQGWTRNWESFHVFCGWDGGGKHIDAEEEAFARLWADKATRAIVVDVPAAVREDLLRFLPAEGEPRRLATRPPAGGRETLSPKAPASKSEDAATVSVDDRRRAVWDFIWSAPRRPEGVAVAQATSAVVPWPHQTRAFTRMIANWPPRLLIADEVGLGKTIEAGLLMRYAWLSGKAKRVLVLAPRAVLTQWQLELREKFNLNWPIYDGRTLTRYPSPMLRGRHEREVSRADWHKEPFVIASSQLMRRRERQAELLEQAEPWDLVVIDEAHHARRKSPGQPTEGAANLLLRLAQGLAQRSKGMLLLTATPMQVHPVEVWDLLSLLGMPRAWTRAAFVEFFRRAANPNPSHEDFEALAEMFRAAEAAFGPMRLEGAIRRTPGRSRLKAQKVLRALRDSASIPRRQLSGEERRAALAIMRAHTPVAALISRNTRDLLREYHRQGLLATPIANREVADEFLPMTPAEAEVYAAVENYISTTYNNAAQEQRSAVGFVMTTYRKRLASSFFALRMTLQERLDRLRGAMPLLPAGRNEEDAADDEDESGDVADEDAVEADKRAALRVEERSDIEALLLRVSRLPPDSKAQRLEEVLRSLLAGSYRAADDSLLGPYDQVIVFTQYTDTLDYLRDFLKGRGFSILCFSGRGGEWLQPDGSWRTISREETRRRFREKQSQVLLCTDAAAEGLNFQFCGALVNFDAPWNPMRIEQRIGRVDRFGQAYGRIAVVNLLYEDTVETDVYRALRSRIRLFTSVVGRLQPILSALPARIAEATLASAGDRERVRAQLVASIEQDTRAAEGASFDIDEAVEATLDAPPRQAPLYDLDQLTRLIDRRDLLPPGSQAVRTSSKEVFWTEPGAPQVSVTTDADFFAEHPESVELWSPGSPAFPGPVSGASAPESDASSLDELLE